QLEAALEHLQEIELPGAIFPLALAVNVLLDFVISRMGVKVRLANKILDLTGVRAAIVEELTDAILKNSMLDPNTYWVRDLLAKVVDAFREGRNTVVTTLYDIIWKVAEVTGIEALKIKRVATKQPVEFKLDTETVPTPEAELFPSVTELPTGEALEQLPLTPG